LDLERNQIKSINGAAFTGLPNLNKVHLGGNKCISQVFEGKDEINSMFAILTSKCGSVETTTSVKPTTESQTMDAAHHEEFAEFCKFLQISHKM